MVSTIFRLAGFDVERKPGGYPGWKPEPANDIVRKAQAVHLEILGKTPELVAMHAGLECSVIGEKHPGMPMISFGPHIVDVHSPKRAAEDLVGGPFLGSPEGAAGAAVRHDCRSGWLAPHVPLHGYNGSPDKRRSVPSARNAWPGTRRENGGPI
jgi:hypothetical protein